MFHKQQIPFIVLIVLFFSQLLPGFDFSPPYQDITTWTAGNQFYYKVFDTSRNAWIEDHFNFYQQTIPESVNNGVVAFVDDHYIHTAIYDPVRGSWFYAYWGNGSIVDELINRDGVVAWTDNLYHQTTYTVFDPIQNRWMDDWCGNNSVSNLVNDDGVAAWIDDYSHEVGLAVYDQELGAWQEISYYSYNASGLTTQGGVAAWISENYVHYAVYDLVCHSWMHYSENFQSPPFNLTILDSTIYFWVGSNTYSRGYDSTNGNWTNTPTKPLAQFLVSTFWVANGYWTYFYDMSIGASSIEWTFGDGQQSFDRSTLHMYDTIDQFTVTQSLVGSGGYDNLSKTINNLDTEPPTGSMIINNGEDETFSNYVTLSISGNDDSGIIKYMRIFNGLPYRAYWQPFSSSITWAFSPPEGGIEGVYIQLQDEAGNISSLIYDSIQWTTAPVLNSPTDGETWNIGSTQNITWEYLGTSENTIIRLILLQDDTVLGTIAENIPIADLSYSWNVGQYDTAIANTGNDYKIRIETMSGTYIGGGGNTFTIIDPSETITVTYPSGDEEWITGNSYYIHWSYENLTGDITIELYKNDTFHTLIGTEPITSKKYLWAIPQGFETGNDYKIRISRNIVEDFSNEDYAILAQPTQAKNPDFNNDYHADIFWRNNTTGENRIWYMNGAEKTSSETIRAAGSLWQIGGTGDFNSDGNTDILWRHSNTGENAIWYMNGSAYTGMTYIELIDDLNWKMCGTADFNNDTKPDILWRNVSTGRNVIWYMDNDVKLQYAIIQNEKDMNWQIGSTSDFNGDGKPDILWRNYATGENRLWYMDNAVLTGTASVPSVTNLAWRIVGTADFNNDGKMDILWRHDTSGKNIIWFMNDNIKLSWLYVEQEPDLTWEIVNN